MRIAAEAVADGHIKAINPLLKVLDRLDRYQRTAKVTQVYDDEARKKLMDKLNRAAANLGYDQIIAASKAAAEASQSQGSGGLGGVEEAKEKTPWGGRRKPLKRLDSAKEIQAFPLIFLGRALLDFAQFDLIWIRLGISLDVIRCTSAPPTSS